MTQQNQTQIRRLDYRNPEDWGKSPLTDRALQIQEREAIKNGTHPDPRQA